MSDSNKKNNLANTSNIEETQKTLHDEIKLFTQHLESLNITLPITMYVLKEAGKKFSEDLDNFILENCSVAKETEKEKSILIKAEHYSDWKKKSFYYNNFGMASDLVPRSFFVSLVSQYDAYLGRLLRTLFLSKREIFDKSERTFTYSEISSYESLADFKEQAIEKEVESILRESHSQHFKTMEKKFGLTLTKDLKIWPIFIELTERRNLFVHTDGIVSKQYMVVCKENNFDLKNIKEGLKLGVPKEYYEQAYNCLYEIGVKLGHTLWRKLLPDELENADKSFAIITYDLVERSEYNLACTLMDMALHNWKFFNDYRKSVIVVNCAQAHKWAGREDECKRIMASTDWSAKSNEFMLADAVLKDDWQQSADIMKRIGNVGAVSEIDYRDWPLFKKFRNEEAFLEAYKEIFGKDFEKQSTTEVISKAESSDTLKDASSTDAVIDNSSEDSAENKILESEE